MNEQGVVSQVRRKRVIVKLNTVIGSQKKLEKGITKLKFTEVYSSSS